MCKVYALVTVLATVSIASLAGPAPPCLAASHEAETSVVWLTVRSADSVIETDPFFELLDMGDHVLVPLIALSKRLPVDVTLDVEANTALVSSKVSSRQAVIDLDAQAYTVSGSPLWIDQPPIVVGSDIFISVYLIEFLSEADIEWNPKRQELTIWTDWLEGEEDEPLDTSDPDGGRDDSQSESQVDSGSIVSIGRVQYGATMTYARGSDDQERLVQLVDARIDGRAGSWAVSVAGEAKRNSLSETYESRLSLIRTKLLTERSLTILGDSQLALERTLDKIDLRGLMFSSPGYQPGKQVMAFTSISGAASHGDTVSLYVDGSLRRTMTVDERNSYRFDSVQLRVKRVNVIRVEIVRPDGTKTVSVQRLSAVPRLLALGSGEFLAAYGSYRKTNASLPWNTWEGIAGIARARLPVSSDITVDLEAAATSAPSALPFTSPEAYGSVLGTVFRLGQDLIVTLDWLVGGAESASPLEQGWQASLLYCLENGFVEATAFRVPPSCTMNLRADDGTGYGLEGAHDLPNNATIGFSGQTRELRDTTGDRHLDANLVYTRRSASRLGNTLTCSLTRNEWHSGQSPIAPTATPEYSAETEARIEHKIRHEGLFRASEIIMSNTSTNVDSDAVQTHDALSVSGELAKTMTESTRLGIGAFVGGGWRNGSLEGVSMKLSSELTLDRDLAWYSVYGLTRGQLRPQAGETLHVTESESRLGLAIQRLLNETTIASLAMSARWYSPSGNSSLVTKVSAIHRLPGGNGVAYASLAQINTMTSGDATRLSASSGIRFSLKSGLGISLEAGRQYSDPMSNEYEDSISLSLRHAIGFAGGRATFLRYSDDEDMSYIGGVVYLDSNSNGIRDEGERGLKGIVVALGGRRTETDDQGHYRFEGMMPGVYKVGLDLRYLSADYTPTTDDQLIRLRENENAIIDIGLTMNGTISGIIFLDDNANGRMDDGDAPMTWVAVTLDGEQKAFTDSGGRFCFENVPMGTHTIEIPRSSIPKGLAVLGPSSFDVTIADDRLDSPVIYVPVVYLSVH